MSAFPYTDRQPHLSSDADSEAERAETERVAETMPFDTSGIYDATVARLRICASHRAGKLTSTVTSILISAVSGAHVAAVMQSRSSNKHPRNSRTSAYGYIDENENGVQSESFEQGSRTNAQTP